MRITLEESLKSEYQRVSLRGIELQKETVFLKQYFKPQAKEITNGL